MKKKPPQPVTPKTIMLLAAETALDVRTVRRVVLEGGEPRSAATKEALASALDRLDLKPIGDELRAHGRIRQTFIAQWQDRNATKEAR